MDALASDTALPHLRHSSQNLPLEVDSRAKPPGSFCNRTKAVIRAGTR